MDRDFEPAGDKLISEAAGLVGADRLRLGSRIRDQYQGRPAPSLAQHIEVALTPYPSSGQRGS